MRPISPRTRLCLITLPYVAQLCVAVVSLVCYYCGFTLMLRDWISGAEIGEVSSFIEKILGHGWMVLNSISVFYSIVQCVLNLYSAWKYGYIMSLPWNTVSHVFLYMFGPSNHPYSQAVRNAYKVVPSSTFHFLDLATTLGLLVTSSNIPFAAVCLYRSRTSAWWKKVDGGFDEPIREENESMERAARLAREGVLQYGKELVQYLEKAPETHHIITGSMCLTCHRGSFTDRELDGSVGEHDRLVGIKEGAQTLELRVAP